MKDNEGKASILGNHKFLSSINELALTKEVKNITRNS